MSPVLGRILSDYFFLLFQANKVDPVSVRVRLNLMPTNRAGKLGGSAKLRIILAEPPAFICTETNQYVQRFWDLEQRTRSPRLRAQCHDQRQPEHWHRVKERFIDPLVCITLP